MRILFSTLTLLIFNSAFSQNADSLSNKKWSIGFSVSPDYCFRTLQSDPSTSWIKDRRDTMESPQIGFTAGSVLDYQLNLKFTLETGVLLTKQGENYKDLLLSFSPPDPSLPKYVRYNFHYWYAQIPLSIKYYIVNCRFGLYLHAGAAANVFITESSRTTFTYEDGHQSKEFNFQRGRLSPLNPSFLIGFGYKGKINKKMSFDIEPIYRRSIISIIDAPIKQWNYSIGLNCGIHFGL